MTLAASDSQLKDFTRFAEALADASGEILRDAFGSIPTAEVKPDASPVTEVDRAVESRLREMIAEAFPRHGIMGEEFGSERLAAEHVWVLDPIDGTGQFLAGIPVFGTLIALARDGVPVLGVIDHPATQERWVGARGAASTRNGAPITTRACEDVEAALMTTSNPDFYAAEERAAFERLKAAARWTLYGGSCYAYALLASGRTDLAVDPSLLDAHDFCALAPVITGAGGVMTDWRGEPLTIHSDGTLLAAGDRRVHARALEILAR